MNNLEEVIKEKNNEIEALKKENWHLIVLHQMSADLDESRIFHCDKCDFEIGEENALETHVELYYVNPCQMCNINFDKEDELKEHIEVYHIKSPQKTQKKPNFNIPLK